MLSFASCGIGEDATVGHEGPSTSVDDGPTISVIVPVYNTAPYVQECLSSIAAQTFGDFECIVVDDCSTDGSGAIVDEFCRTDGRFSVIHQENRGPGAARNAGLDRARGAFINFVDSDDVCHPDLLERLLDAVRETGAPLACAGFRHFDDAPAECRTYRDECVAPFDGVAVVDEEGFWRLRYAPPVPLTGTHPWGKLYRRDLFDTIRFREDMLFEDVEEFTRVIAGCKTVALIPSILMDYRVHSHSILGSLTPKGHLDGLEAYILRGESFLERRLNLLVRLNLPPVCGHAAEYWVDRREADEEQQLRAVALLSRAQRQCRVALRAGWPGRHLAIRMIPFAISWRLYTLLAILAVKGRDILRRHR